MKRLFITILLVTLITIITPVKNIDYEVQNNSKILNNIADINAKIEGKSSDDYDITCLIEVGNEHTNSQIGAIYNRNIVKEYFQTRNETIAKKLNLFNYNYSVSFFAPFIEINFDDLDEYRQCEKELMTKLCKNDDVKNVSINYMGYDEATVNTGLCSTDYSLATAKIDIGVSSLTHTGDGVKVGVIESGTPNSTINLKSNKYTILSSNYTTSHCTWVTSILGGTTGVAEDAYIYCMGVIDCGFTNCVNSLIFTYDVDVINMSYGTGTSGYYDYYCKYIDYIIDYSNCAIVVSAGNEGPGTAPNVISPGCGMNAITVGSIASDKNVSYFSSWNTNDSYIYKPDMVAPGERISNIPNLTGEDSGTSFAAPLVTGIIALLMEEFPVLKHNPSLVKASLQNGCVKLSSQTVYFDEQCGFGLVNYQNARTYLYNSQYSNFTIPTNGINGDIVASYNVTIPASNVIEVNANWSIKSSYTNNPNSSSYTPSYTQCYVKLYDVQNSTYVKSTIKNSNFGYLTYVNSNSVNKVYRIDIVINGTKASGGAESGSFVYNMYYTHTHNYTYTWVNYIQHRQSCNCGVSGLQAHIVSPDAYNSGQMYATCLLCGGNALVDNYNKSPITYPSTANGSFMLPNGVIVIVEEDIDAYIEGTLIFNYPLMGIMSDYDSPKYILKRR